MDGTGYCSWRIDDRDDEDEHHTPLNSFLDLSDGDFINITLFWIFPCNLQPPLSPLAMILLPNHRFVSSVDGSVVPTAVIPSPLHHGSEPDQLPVLASFYFFFLVFNTSMKFLRLFITIDSPRST
jgi:hypothetical protein